MFKAANKYPKIEEIKDFGVFVKINPIEMGWEPARKYYAETACGSRYFLRIEDRKKSYAFAKWDFKMQKKLFSAGVSMPKPVAIGRCEEGIYTLFEWVEGKTLLGSIPHLDPTELYALGVEIGNNLHIIHSTPPINPIARLWLSCLRAHLKKAALFLLCSSINSVLRILLRCVKIHAFERYNTSVLHVIAPEIKNLKEYLNVRPNPKKMHARNRAIYHGDYGTHNVLVSAAKQVMIIDFSFNSSDCGGIYGDPLFELASTLVNSLYDGSHNLDASYSIVIGTVHGYFGGDIVADEVWAQITYYMAKYLISAPLHNFGLSTRAWLKRYANFLHYSDKTRCPVPPYYRKRGESPDDVERYKYRSCFCIEQFWIHFEYCDGYTQVSPCHNYIQAAQGSRLRDTPEKTISEFVVMQTKIMAESIRFSKNAEEDAREDRLYTKPCISCPHYQVHEWVTHNRSHCISCGSMPMDDMEDALDVIEFLRQKELLANTVTIEHEVCPH